MGGDVIKNDDCQGGLLPGLGGHPHGFLDGEVRHHHFVRHVQEIKPVDWGS